MFSTMSISDAPSRMAAVVSAALISMVLAPNGNPTTAHTFVAQPANSSATKRTQQGFTQTLAKPYWRASAHTLRMSDSVASGFSKV